MGRQERLKILLIQQDPATVSRVMVYYDYLSQGARREDAEIREHMQRLADTEAESATKNENWRACMMNRHELAAMQRWQDKAATWSRG